MRHDVETLFDRNPGYVSMYCAAITMCSERQPRQKVEEILDAARSGAYQIQTAASIVDALVRNGALEQQITVDSQPYAGTLRDLQEDESIEPDAVVEQFLVATAEGLEYAAAASDTNQISQLIKSRPEYSLGFYVVLESCMEDGKSTSELQDALRQASALPIDERTGLERVHTSFFTGALERVGALEWREGRWHTTAAGREAAA